MAEPLNIATIKDGDFLMGNKTHKGSIQNERIKAGYYNQSFIKL